MSVSGEQLQTWSHHVSPLSESSLHFLSSFFVLFLLPLCLLQTPPPSLGGIEVGVGGNSALPRQRRFSRVEITGRD